MKKKKLPLRPDNVRAYACDLASRQIEALYENFDNLGIEESVEYLHDLRVASRRLREVLSFFGFLQDEAKLRKTISRIKRITRTVGQSREMDVNLELLSNFTLPPHPGIEGSREHFLELFALEQEKLRKRMDKELKKMKLREQKTEYLKTARAFLQEPVSLSLGDGEPAVASLEALSERAAAAVRSRFSGLKEFEGIQANPQNDGGLHRLRIQVKKLRYTLEICDPLYENRFERAIFLAKELQDLLGKIHDYGVLIERLSLQGDLLEKKRRWHLLEDTRSIVRYLNETKCSFYQQFGPAYKAFLEEVSSCIPAEGSLLAAKPEQVTVRLDTSNPFIDF